MHSMRVLSRGLVALMSLALVACGILVSAADDGPVVPDRADASNAEDGTSGDGTHDSSAVLDAGPDACAAGPATCTPELITKLDAAALRLVVAGNNLYVAKSGAKKSVWRLAKTPLGAVANLDPRPEVPEEVANDSDLVLDSGGDLYWGTPNGLRRHDSTAGPDPSTDAGLTSLAELGAPVSALRLSGARLYYAVRGPAGGAMANTGHIASCALPGCSDVQVSGYMPYPSDFVLIGNARWWMGTDSSLQNLALRTNGGVYGDNPPQQTPSRMTTDGQRIYWSTADGLRAFTVSPPALQTLVVTGAANRIRGVILDADGTLYVTQDAALKSCKPAGGACTLTELAKGPGTAVDVAVDSTFAYWATDEGSIFRLRKR